MTNIYHITQKRCLYIKTIFYITHFILYTLGSSVGCERGSCTTNVYQSNAYNVECSIMYGNSIPLACLVPTNWRLWWPSLNLESRDIPCTEWNRTSNNIRRNFCFYQLFKDTLKTHIKNRYTYHQAASFCPYTVHWQHIQDSKRQEAEWSTNPSCFEILVGPY